MIEAASRARGQKLYNKNKGRQAGTERKEGTVGGFDDATGLCFRKPPTTARPALGAKNPAFPRLGRQDERAGRHFPVMSDLRASTVVMSLSSPSLLSSLPLFILAVCRCAASLRIDKDTLPYNNYSLTATLLQNQTYNKQYTTLVTVMSCAQNRVLVTDRKVTTTVQKVPIHIR